jgi:predicted extracellular nuclease
MILRKSFRPVSLLALVCLVLASAVDITPALAASNSVVISEFRVRGPQGGNDEFIELYNLSSSPVNIGGWKVNGSNNAGTTSTRATIPANIVVNPGCHYLLTNSGSSGYSGSVTGDQTYSTGVTDDGGIALLNGTTVIDAVGMSTGSAYKEGTQLASLGSTNANRGYERKPGGTSGSGTDTDNNSADFQLKTPSDPQNSSSVCIGQSTGISAVGAANPATVDIASTTLLTVTISPNTATGVSVSADLTPLGGAANTAFYDDGTHGDATAGDDVFSLSYTIPNSTQTGAQTLPVSASDGQGHTASTTISVTVNPPQLTIMEIQGSGDRSPYESKSVRTTGVVTAVKSNGFWIQDLSGDGNPATSDGLFIFGGSPKPAVGDSVLVAGKVQEFATSGDPSAAPATELSGSPTVSVISTGNPLPEAVTVTAADLDPNGPIDQLEHLEGMRVHVDVLNVIGPTSGTLTEKDAVSTSNGVFFGEIPGQPRPFREAGIELPAAAPAGSPCCIPFWNGAPHRIRVDSKSQTTSSAVDVTSGAVVANLTGPLDFGQHTYTIVTDTAPTVVQGNISAIPVPVADGNKEFTVGAFNMERFYDTVDDPGVSDVVLSSTAFNNRLNKASLAIRHVMNSPDVLAVEEMDNINALTLLANKLNADAVAETGVNPNYVPFLEEGNDVGGIDVGFLVKATRITVNSVTQVGKDTTFVQPDGTTALLNDRPPLVLQASVTNEHETTPFTVIVNHLRSLNSVDDPADGPRVRAKRAAQAEFLANLIQSMQSGDPNAKVVTVGDYNAFAVSDGYVDMMGTIAGTPTPADQVVLASPDLVDPNLTDLETTLPKDQQYSYNFDGVAQTLDHVLVTQSMYGIFGHFAYARNDADFPEIYRNDPNRSERLSDHDMPVAYFNLPLDHTAPVLTLPGDFTVEATSPAGAVVTFTATALDANDGATTVTCNPASATTFALGTTTVSCTSTDARQNTASGEFHVKVVDTTAPVVAVTGVTDGANYVLGSVPVAGCSTTDTVSPIAVEATLSVTGGSPNHVGTFTATCSGAQDTAGNAAVPVSATYTVSYDWSGFLPPVSNGGIHNAGSTIPLKWTLAGAGNMTSVATLTAAANIDCAGPAEGVPFAIQTPGNSPFTFINGLFQVNWQTKGLSAGCYSLLLTLDDGTTRSTIVQLR